VARSWGLVVVEVVVVVVVVGVEAVVEEVQEEGWGCGGEAGLCASAMRGLACRLRVSPFLTAGVWCVEVWNASRVAVCLHMRVVVLPGCLCARVCTNCVR
jgi:hypothetical protein